MKSTQSNTTMKNTLKTVYDTVHVHLTQHTDWKAYRSDDWILRFVGIMDDGTIQAIVVWKDENFFNKEQYVPLSLTSGIDFND
jgi:hypothetical protein